MQELQNSQNSLEKEQREKSHIFSVSKLIGGGLVAKLCPSFATPWTVAHQAPLSMGFSRQEYWSGLSFPPPGDLPDPGMEPTSLMCPALAGGFFTTEPPGKPGSLQM